MAGPGAALVINGYAILVENEMIDTSRVPSLRVYLFVWFGLATLAFVWVTFVRWIIEPKREYRITGAKHHPAVNAIELRARPVGRRARFHAFKAADLDTWANSTPGLTVHRWITEERGHPTVEAIADEFVSDLRERAVMIWGPDGMITDLTQQLLAAGLHRGQIRAEVEIGPPGRWQVASPALRYTRAAATVLFAAFVLAVAVSAIGRAVGA